MFLFFTLLLVPIDCSSSNDDKETNLSSSKIDDPFFSEDQSGYELDLRETFKINVIIFFHDSLTQKLQDSAALQALHCLREDCPEYSLAYSNPNDDFVDPAAEELIKYFSEEQRWELDWNLHNGDKVRLHIKQAVGAKCIFNDTGNFKPLLKNVQLGANIVVNCIPDVLRSVIIKFELIDYPEGKLSLDEYIKVDASLIFWNDRTISPGDLEFSNNYETDIKKFREGGYEDTKKLWNNQNPHLTQNGDCIEVLKNREKNSLCKKHEFTSIDKYDKYFLRLGDKIKFVIKSNIKSGHCHLKLKDGLLKLRNEIEIYEVNVVCKKKLKRTLSSNSKKIKKTNKEISNEDYWIYF